MSRPLPRPPAPERPSGIYSPAYLTWVAILVGWIGIFLAYLGEPLGAALAGLAMLVAVLAFFRGRDLARDQRKRLRDAVAAAAARNRDLTLLRQMADELLRVDTFDQLFEVVGKVAADLFASEGSAVLLVAEEGRFFRLVAGTGPFARRVGTLIPGERSLAGWVMANDEGAIVDDAATDPRVHPPPGIPLEARRVIMAPLRSSGLTLGTIAVTDRNDGQNFSQADLDLLQTLADQVAVGIDRTRALEASQAGAQALQAKNEELLRATRLKSEFLANMSHELRTPLNAIIGFTDLILSGGAGPVDPRQQEFLESVSRNGNHLLGLINNVLDLSKIEAGSMAFTLAPTDLRQAIHAAVADTASLRSAKQQTVEVTADEAGLTILADGQRVRQILFNLLSNASKFSPDKGHISLSATRTRAPLPVPAERASDKPGIQVRDAVWIAVSDDGIGVRPEDMPSLFVEFSQVDTSASRRAQGTGLGLALSRKFVEALGGTIGAESIHGKGSTFWFILPVEGPVRRADTLTRPADLDRRLEGDALAP
jgi:signal transduction histidine kinase/membrane protein implicated in regulation of membrane protease activity